MNAPILVVLVFAFVGPDTKVSFKVVPWSFLCSLIDRFPCLRSEPGRTP
jgi:hypothetical protein